MRAQTSFARFSDATSHSLFSASFAALRIVIGIQFLMAGLDKVVDWSAAGYLSTATGPLAGLFQSMAGNILVDQLNIWGLTLIGLALILGLAVRPASILGAILMMLYYLAHFEQNTAHGFIEDHIVYALVLLVFAAGGAGHILGLDSMMKRYLPKRKKLASLLFG